MADLFEAYLSYAATISEYDITYKSDEYPQVEYGRRYEAAYMTYGAPQIVGTSTLVPGKTDLTGLRVTEVLDVMWTRIWGAKVYGKSQKLTGTPEHVDWWRIGPLVDESKMLFINPVGSLSAFARYAEDWHEPANIAEFFGYIQIGRVIRANLGDAWDASNFVMIQTADTAAGDPPLIRLTAELVTPYAAELAPTNGYIDKSVANKLTWKFVYDPTNVWGVLHQNGATVQIRQNGSTAQEYTVSGETQEYTIPANTLTADAEWRVQVTSEHGVTSEWSEWCGLQVVDSLSTAETIAPKNKIVEKNGGLLFSWLHIIATGTAQTGYQLQYRLTAAAADAWEDMYSASTSAQSALVPEADVPSGGIYWRVRTANADGAWGAWSDPAAVIIQAPPAPPSITDITGTTAPTIAWQSAEQQGYEVSVDDQTTGTVYGTDKSYTWPDVLEDGAHTVGVRVINQLGLWSEWAYGTFTAANVPGDPLDISAAAEGYGVAIYWTDGSTVEVWRDGVKLATTGTSPYIDNTAAGENSYFLRRVQADGYYTDSETVTVTMQIADAAIAVEGDWAWLPLIWSEGDMPAINTTLTPQLALVQYSGRELPAAEVSKHQTRAHEIAYALEDAADRQRLTAMLGRLVWYRHGAQIIRGVLTSIGETRTWWGWAESLRIEEVSTDARG